MLSAFAVPSPAGFAGRTGDPVHVGMTAAGAALVFGTKNVPRKLLSAMLGFAVNHSNG